MSKIIIVCSLILLGTGLGCAAFSAYVTPAEIDENAVSYVVNAGVAEPNDFLGYPNLLKADKLYKDVEAAYSIVLFSREQQIQKEDFEHSVHQGTTFSNFTAGQQRENKVFGEKGYLSLGLSLMGFGTLTGVVGLLRKRPQDITKQDMEQTIAQITGKSADELSEKQKQLIEVVRGVQKFIDKNRDKLPTVVKNLKGFFDVSQDTSTKAAVAQLKKLL